MNDHHPGADTNKTAFRAWSRQTSKAIGNDLISSISTASCANVMRIIGDQTVISPSLRMMVYLPIRGEIDPIMAASAVIESKGTLCVGRGVSKTSPLQVVTIPPETVASGRWNLGDCETDAWGMQVPRDHAPVAAKTLDAVLVPGLAFDERGNRLGRGAGVYDRFLASLPPSVLRIGLIPDELVVAQLPTEAHDVPMHFVATELRVIPGAPFAR